MKIKYKKIDFIKENIPFIIFLAIMSVEVILADDIIVVIVFIPFFIMFLGYFFIYPYFLKRNIKINFDENEIIIKNKKIYKEIRYSDIETIIVSKNILGSYDILINDNNYDNRKGRYIYYFLKEMSVEFKNSFIICDIINIDEIERVLTAKVGFKNERLYNYNEENTQKYLERFKILKIFDIFTIFLSLWFFILSIGIKTNIPITGFFIYLVIKNIIKFRKEYKIIRVGAINLLIKNKRNTKRLYSIDIFEIEDKIVRLKTKIKSYTMFDIVPMEYILKDKKN